MFDVIREIVEGIIGNPRRETEGWTEYNCVYCAMEKGVESDGKYNLALNYGDTGNGKAFFHCWRCGTSGKLSKLIKDFGSENDLLRYYNEIKNIRESSLFTVNFGEDKLDIVNEDFVELPNDFRTLQKNDRYSKDAFDYLYGRGLDDKIIRKFNIGYVPYWSKDKVMSSRIIIPSYSYWGDLNYYVARDYTGKRIYRKYNNPLIKKTNFVFNEKKVNWYENVTLVEGAFDHIVVPNSIPLLGKTLKSDYATYAEVVNKAMANVNIFLDDDAVDDAVKIYRLLDSTRLKGKVRIIQCPDGYDASDIYQKYKSKGIIEVMRTAKKLDEFDLMFFY